MKRKTAKSTSKSSKQQLETLLREVITHAQKEKGRAQVSALKRRKADLELENIEEDIRSKRWGIRLGIGTLLTSTLTALLALYSTFFPPAPVSHPPYDLSEEEEAEEPIVKSPRLLKPFVDIFLHNSRPLLHGLEGTFHVALHSLAEGTHPEIISNAVVNDLKDYRENAVLPMLAGVGTKPSLELKVKGWQQSKQLDILTTMFDMGSVEKQSVDSKS